MMNSVHKNLLSQLTSFMTTACGTTPTPAIAVALSGGGDSLALCLLLKQYCDDKKIPLMAFHINHGVRKEAKAEEKILADKMAQLAIPFYHAALPPFRHKKNFHHHARIARYLALHDLAMQHKAGIICLGHHQDDIAENFLIRLSRRAGLRGLATMPSHIHAPLPFSYHQPQLQPLLWLRPFMNIKKQDLQFYLKEKNIPYFNDPSNHAPPFLRARVRKALAMMADDNILDSADIAKSAEYLSMAQDFFQKMADEKKPNFVCYDRGMVIIHKKTNHEKLHPLLCQYFLSSSLQQWGGHHFPPPQYQQDKILSATSQQIFSYHHFWVIADIDNIFIIKKPSTLTQKIMPDEKLWWNDCYHIHNHSKNLLWVTSWQRGKKSLVHEFGRDFDDRITSPPALPKGRPHSYFYQTQPMILLNHNDPDNYWLPTLALQKGKVGEPPFSLIPKEL